MKLIEMMEPDSDFVLMQVKKLAPPLVTLLSAESEIQYVALRNINLIVQKRSVVAVMCGIDFMEILWTLDHSVYIWKVCRIKLEVCTFLT